MRVFECPLDGDDCSKPQCSKTVCIKNVEVANMRAKIIRYIQEHHKAGDAVEIIALGISANPKMFQQWCAFVRGVIDDEA